MVRRGNCIIIPAIIFALAQSSCASLLTGKTQKISVNPVDSSLCVTAFLPKSEETPKSISDDMGSLPVKKSDCYKYCQPVHSNRIELPRPLPNQTLYLGIHACTDSSNMNLSKCTQTFVSQFNEPALLNFILPWNWMIDAYNGALFRWKINKPLSR